MSLHDDDVDEDALGRAQLAAVTRTVGRLISIGTSLGALGLGVAFWDLHRSTWVGSESLQVSGTVPGGYLSWACGWFVAGLLTFLPSLLPRQPLQRVRWVLAVGNLFAFGLSWTLAGVVLYAAFVRSGSAWTGVSTYLALGTVYLGLALVHGTLALLRTKLR